jgi:hypothetical protein
LRDRLQGLPVAIHQTDFPMSEQMTPLRRRMIDEMAARKSRRWLSQALKTW